MEEIILEDKKAMIFLNNLGNSNFDQFWILVSEKWFWIPLYIIFLYFLFKNFNRKSFLYILLFIALGITASDQIANIFKYGFERLRTMPRSFTRRFNKRCKMWWAIRFLFCTLF